MDHSEALHRMMGLLGTVVEECPLVFLVHAPHTKPPHGRPGLATPPAPTHPPGASGCRARSGRRAGRGHEGGEGRRGPRAREPG